jgi:thiosulfate reductase / polysulfide reductase chain A
MKDEYGPCSEKKFKLDRRKFVQLSALGTGSLFFNSNADGLESAFQTLPSDTETISTCNQCYLGCGIIATLRAGKVVQLRGNPSSPTNRGKICPKAHAGVFKLYHPERVLTPMKRVGKRGEGKFVAVSWEHALDLISTNLKKSIEAYGGKSLALMHNIDNARPDIYKRFLYSLGSPNFFDHPGSAGFHIGGGIAAGKITFTPHYQKAENILIVGANPLACKELCWSARELMKAKHRGATIITVDPRMTETAMHSSRGMWVPIKPGTDGIFLAGLCRHLIETNKYDHKFVELHTFGFKKFREHVAIYTLDQVCQKTDIPKEQFLSVAKAIAKGKTAIDGFSGISFQADASYTGHMKTALSALLGCIDSEGGVLPLPIPRIEFKDVAPSVSMPMTERIDRGNFGKLPLPFLPPEKNLSFIGIGQNLPKHILSEKPYPLKSLIISYTNPVYSYPDTVGFKKALEKLDLVVTIDAFVSDTSMYADIILPGATYLEEYDFNDHFPPFRGVVMRKPVVRPRGQSLGGQDIIIKLAKKMGLGKQFPFKDYRDFLEKQTKDSPIDFKKLEKFGFVDTQYRVGETLEKGFTTPSGRIELYSSVLAFSKTPPLKVFDAWEETKDPAYPFYLISYRLPYHANNKTASNAYLDAISGENQLWINTQTAKKMNLQTGMIVKITSETGSLEVPIFVTQGIHPQTMALSHHFGHKAYSKICRGKGARFNDVGSDKFDPIGFGMSFNTRIKVEKI